MSEDCQIEIYKRLFKGSAHWLLPKKMSTPPPQKNNNKKTLLKMSKRISFNGEIWFGFLL